MCDIYFSHFYLEGIETLKEKRKTLDSFFEKNEFELAFNKIVRFICSCVDTCRGWSFFRKAAPLQILINQDVVIEGLKNRSIRGKFRLPFLRFLWNACDPWWVKGYKILISATFMFQLDWDILPVTQQYGQQKGFGITFSLTRFRLSSNMILWSTFSKLPLSLGSWIDG